MFCRQIAALILISAFAILLGGCSPAEEPAKEPTKVDQPEKTPGSRPGTPIIILEHRADTGFTDWKYKKTEQDPAQVQTNSNQSMFSECDEASLRTDFIGDEVVEFVYLSKGESDWTKAKEATKIVAKKDGVKIEISKSSYGGAKFYVEDSNCTHCDSCIATATASGEVETGTVPSQLYDLNYGDLKHEENGTLVSIEKFKLVIKYR